MIGEIETMGDEKILLKVDAETFRRIQDAELVLICNKDGWNVSTARTMVVNEYVK